MLPLAIHRHFMYKHGSRQCREEEETKRDMMGNSWLYKIWRSATKPTCPPGENFCIPSNECLIVPSMNTQVVGNQSQYTSCEENNYSQCVTILSNNITKHILLASKCQNRPIFHITNICHELHSSAWLFGWFTNAHYISLPLPKHHLWIQS